MAIFKKGSKEETMSDFEKASEGKRNIINVHMVPVKLTYFLWGCTNGSYPIYLNPFLTSSGISKTKAGLITGIIFAVSSVAAPLWGMLSDYTGRRKLILALICVTAAVSMVTLPIAESQLVTKWQTRNKTCPAIVAELNFSSTTYTTRKTHNHTQFYNLQPTNITRPCANKAIPVRRRCTFHLCRGDLNTLFYAMLLIISVGAVFFAPLPSYVDAIAFNVIKTSPVKASYGGQRIFGTLGGIATMYLTGFLIDRYQFEGMSMYSIPFFVFVPISLMLIPCGCFLSLQYERTLQMKSNDLESNEAGKLVPSEKKVGYEVVKSTESNMKQELFRMLCKMDVIVFMVTALIAGMAINLFIFFTEMLIDDVLEVSKREASFIFIVHNLTSIITFPFSGKLVQLLGGPKLTMIIGMLCHCIRHIVMSYTRSYWLMLSIQGLHCLDFALLLCAMMEYIHDSSPTEIKMTMTLIFRTVKYSVGTFLVNILGGYVYQTVGGPLLFRWNGILCGAWGIFLCLYYSFKHYEEKHNGEKTTSYEKDTGEKVDPDSPTVCNTFAFDASSLTDNLKETDI